ncbi:MAG: ABC transporter ATP-binding protein [Nitrososphaerales archaeon]
MDYKTNGAPIHVLEDINLDVREYEFVSLIGPSGCGKSTIVKLLSGVVVRPSSGTAMIRNSDVQSATKKKEVGVVFQRASLMPWRTVLSNVLLPLEISGNISKESMTRAKELLKFMGLAGFENAYPHTLSGGMQQRVALARALAFDPKILLMDEPFGALDAITRHKLAVELLRIWTQFRKTVLFVTHDISEALFLSDRVVVLSRRPAHVKQIITVDLPRPREVEMQETPKFLAWGREVRKLLEDAE